MKLKHNSFYRTHFDEVIYVESLNEDRFEFTYIVLVPSQSGHFRTGQKITDRMDNDHVLIKMEDDTHDLFFDMLNLLLL